jgi:hypothetical protein
MPPAGTLSSFHPRLSRVQNLTQNLEGRRTRFPSTASPQISARGIPTHTHRPSAYDHEEWLMEESGIAGYRVV